jgi:hypothetical protein
MFAEKMKKSRVDRNQSTMASPIKTWMSVIVGIAIAYFLFYNITQIADNARALENPMGSGLGPNPLAVAASVQADWYIGMGGTGILLVLYGIACLSIFLNKHEQPTLSKSQRTCFIMVGVLLLISFLTSSMAFVELVAAKRPEAVLITSLVLASFRFLLLGGIVGCGVHAIKNN